ncbi:MAG: FMN-binding protein [Nocardioidaceae bacterium]|nr:FMN-binding protein [Nocardioidaceae bacterium]NUS50683.1 FMN-binding protein [Nocardioidaceae bacterium]
MKRISYWILSTVSVVVLLFGYDASHASPTTSTAPPLSVESTTQGSSRSSTTSGSTSGSTSASRTVTGDVADTQWGPVQVALTIKGGRITDVQVKQYPNGNGRDQEINSYALPILVQETKQQQSADIDMVSGATVTSTGYVQSLQSALDQAGL